MRLFNNLHLLNYILVPQILKSTFFQDVNFTKIKFIKQMNEINFKIFFRIFML